MLEQFYGYAKNSTEPNYFSQEDSFIDLGPVYCGVINSIGQIFVAYRNNGTGYVDLAGFLADGSGLLTSFGTDGVVSNVLQLTGDSETMSIDRSSVRIAFDPFGNLLVCAVDQYSSNLFVAKTSQLTGILDTYFGTHGIATITLSSPSITQLQAINDGSIVITGAFNSHQMFIARLTSQGDLDTTFDAQGSQPGISIIQAETNPYQASAQGFAVQSADPYTGDLVVIGFQDLHSTDATPMVTRLFGQPDTIAVRTYPEYIQELGTIDVSFNGGGFNLSNLIADSGIARIVYAYPADSQYAGLLLIGTSSSLTTTIARFNPATLQLDTTFNADGDTPGLYVTTDVWSLSAMAVDANNRIIIAGNYAGVCGAQRLTADGVFDVSFDIFLSNDFSFITCIAQQKSGRYIFAADINTLGYGLAAYQDELVGSNTTLQLDPTFNPMGSYPGMLGICSDTIYSMVINSDDTILAAFTNGYLYIAKIYADGSGPVDGFNINQNLLTPSIPDTGKIALDANENIIAAATIDDDTLQVVRYTSAGIIDTDWNSGDITTLTGMGHSVYLTSLVE